MSAALGAGLYAAAGVSFRQAAVLSIEPFFGFIILCFAAALVYWFQRPESRWRATAAGALLGVSLSCRSTLFAFPALVGAFFLWPRGAARSVGVSVVCFISVCYLALLPWTLRNAVRFGAFIPFENGAASLNLYGASIGMVENPTIAGLIAAGSEVEAISRVQALDETSRGRELSRLALRNIATRPWRFATACARRTPVLWKEQGLLLLFILPLLLRRQIGGLAALLLALLAYFNVHLLMGVTPRYARPAFGLVCALAAAGFGEGLRRLTRGRAADQAAASLDVPLRWTVLAALLATLPIYLVSAVWLLSERPLTAPVSLALKKISDAGVEFAVRGQFRSAGATFSDVLRADPCFGEALVSRAVVRGLEGDVRGEAADYAQAAVCLIGDPRLLCQF